jgi:hypothetical protein
VVIDILASAVALRRAPAQLDRMRDMKKTLAGYRQGLDPAVSDPE